MQKKHSSLLKLSTRCKKPLKPSYHGCINCWGNCFDYMNDPILSCKTVWYLTNGYFQDVQLQFITGAGETHYVILFHWNINFSTWHAEELINFSFLLLLFVCKLVDPLLQHYTQASHRFAELQTLALFHCCRTQIMCELFYSSKFLLCCFGQGMPK